MICENLPNVILKIYVPGGPARHNYTCGRKVHGPVTEHGILLVKWPRNQVENVADKQQK